MTLPLLLMLSVLARCLTPCCVPLVGAFHTPMPPLFRVLCPVSCSCTCPEGGEGRPCSPAEGDGGDGRRQPQEDYNQIQGQVKGGDVTLSSKFRTHDVHVTFGLCTAAFLWSCTLPSHLVVSSFFCWNIDVCIAAGLA